RKLSSKLTPGKTNNRNARSLASMLMASRWNSGLMPYDSKKPSLPARPFLSLIIHARTKQFIVSAEQDAQLPGAGARRFRHPRFQIREWRNAPRTEAALPHRRHART